ncbi:MAG: FecR domain-containing protein, partial [Saprospiraceae bacterium]|nr:FecR domain-containing protein [Saprospiraceae bacterium]
VLEKNNSSATLSTVILSDGTIVTLEPGSRLTYPPVFDGRQRKVYLSGEAFFEVAKNPAQPFLVYTGSSVVRVVGTSFRVRAASGQSPDRIAVRTGRVLVYTYQDFEEAGTDERALAEKALVLLPNEQAMLDTVHQTMQKMPVQNAAEVAAIIAPKELVYDDQPVTEVFQHLANLYGVEINYNQQAMSGCKITTSFRDESLEERLRNICAAIGAQFRLAEGKITISGKACK